jgi:hypothetical protein
MRKARACDPLPYWHRSPAVSALIDKGNAKISSLILFFFFEVPSNDQKLQELESIAPLQALKMNLIVIHL